MVQTLGSSHNEPVRMVLIESLAPHLAESPEVLEVFRRVLDRDDNEVARMAVAAALAGRADRPDVRRVLLDAQVVYGHRHRLVPQQASDQGNILARQIHVPGLGAADRMGGKFAGRLIDPCRPIF